MITGSTTVGVITAASVSAPMMETLRLSPEATMLAGAAGFGHHQGREFE
jgi:GntP family gluconate:H+ symporter